MDFWCFTLCFVCFHIAATEYAKTESVNINGIHCRYITRSNQVYTYAEAKRFCSHNNADLLWFNTKEDFDKFKNAYVKSELESIKTFSFWILASPKYDRIDGKGNISSWRSDDTSGQDFPLANMRGFSWDDSKNPCVGLHKCLHMDLRSKRLQADCCSQRHGAICASHVSEGKSVETSANFTNSTSICSVDLPSSTSGNKTSTWEKVREVIYAGIGLVCILLLLTFCFVTIVVLKRKHRLKKLNAAMKPPIQKSLGTKKLNKSQQVDRIPITLKTSEKDKRRQDGNDKATEIQSEKFGNSSTIQPNCELQPVSDTFQSVTLPRSLTMSQKTKTVKSRSLASPMDNIYEIIEMVRRPKEIPQLKISSDMKNSKRSAQKQTKRTILDFVRRSK